MEGFCHLHVHSQYSLLDGLARIEKLTEKAVHYNMPALAITDHGGIYGAVDFYKSCKARGIKPIMGCEVYVVDDHKVKSVSKETPYHLVLLAQTNQGYKNLLDLITSSHLDGFYYKPRVDKELLNRFSEGIIALSGCIAGEIPAKILKDDEKGAVNALKEYLDIFGKENFFLELQYHGLREEKLVNRWLTGVAAGEGIRVVATNDVHYIDKKDAYTHKVLLGIQTLSVLNNKQSLGLERPEYYFKSPEAMKKLFKAAPSSIQNTLAIAERCNVELDFNTLHLPEIELSDGYTTEQYLRKLSMEGALAKYGTPLPAEVKERLDYELNVIEKMGFAGYFLIVKDIVDFARKNDIAVGVGRGSAAGSIITYVLGITSVDPVKYGLVFERFLNPERISMPDIDIDLCCRGRNKVLEYIRNKYGEKNVAHIGAFITFQARAVLRDTGRAMGLPYEKIDNLTKMVPYSHISLQDLINNFPKIKQLYKRDEEIRRVFEVASKLQGLPRHITQHAAGVVISQKPLTRFCALQRASGKEVITQLDMNPIEDLGLLKIDLLGLRYLTVIHDTLKMVEHRRNLDISPEKIPLEDAKTFKALQEGNTACCFQIESTGMRRLLKRLAPRNIKDVIAVLALYRPGPLGSSMDEEYIKRRKGEQPVEYLHPLLKKVLSDTYGIILYQEQILQVAHLIAGYTMGRADLLRKAVAKKDKEAIKKERHFFLKKARENGVSPQKAGEIFDLIESFGNYGFNKAHSTCYGIMAYRTVYLKEHFTIEYFSSLLSANMDQPGRLRMYITEAKKQGINFKLPHVNKSGWNFSPEGDDAIRVGLALIKGLGAKGVKSILKEREKNGGFTSFADFCCRMGKNKINKKALKALILSGAFDGLGQTRPQLLMTMKWIRGMAPKHHGQLTFLDMGHQMERVCSGIKVGEFSPGERLNHELNFLGHYITCHPLEYVIDRVKDKITHTVEEILEIETRTQVRLAGVVIGQRMHRTRKGERMMFAQLEDLTGIIELVVFPAVLRNYSSCLLQSSLVLAQGFVDINDDGERTVVVKNIYPVN